MVVSGEVTVCMMVLCGERVDGVFVVVMVVYRSSNSQWKLKSGFVVMMVLYRGSSYQDLSYCSNTE